MSERSKLWITGIAALVCVQALASLFLHRGFALTALSDVVQLVLLLSATVSLLPSVAASRGRIQLFWALMMLGMGFWFSYQVLWTYFEVLMRRDVPNPFGGDVVMFLHIVPMTAALALNRTCSRIIVPLVWERLTSLCCLSGGYIFICSR